MAEHRRNLPPAVDPAQLDLPDRTSRFEMPAPATQQTLDAVERRFILNDLRHRPPAERPSASIRRAFRWSLLRLLRRRRQREARRTELVPLRLFLTGQH